MQNIQSRLDNTARLVLGDANTSPLRCLLGLSTALQHLSLEACHPSVVADNQLCLKAPANEDLVLYTAATPAAAASIQTARIQLLHVLASFTQLQQLSIYCFWYAPHPHAPASSDTDNDYLRMRGVLRSLFRSLSSLHHVRMTQLAGPLILMSGVRVLFLVWGSFQP